MAGRVELFLLLLVVILSLSCAILQRRSVRRDGDAVRLVKRHQKSLPPLPPLPPLAALRQKLSAGKPFALPASNDRERRSDDMCGLRKSAVLETDPVRQ